MRTNRPRRSGSTWPRSPQEARQEAERWLADTDWVPEPLRTSDVAVAAEPDVPNEFEALPDFLAEDEPTEPDAEPEPVPAKAMAE